jgi:ketosteroid isomerase-like protein
MRSTIRLAILTLAIVLVSTLAAAQGNNPPASTKESGQTSGHGMTGVEQGMKPSVEEEIKTLDDQRRQATLKGDVNFFQKYLADNYVAIDPRGSEVTRDQVLQNFKNGKTKYESIEVRDRKVRAFGNAAVVNVDSVVKGVSNGHPIDGEYRATMVWVKQGGKWKAVSFTAVPIQATAAAAK